MKKIAVLGLAAAGLLALAGTAQAKEIVGFKICGASGCNESAEHLVVDSSTTVAYSQPGAYYRVELRFGDGQEIIHREQAYWVPSSGLMRFVADSSSWWKPADRSGLAKAAAGLEPYTPRLARVTVKGKPAADPDSYMQLLGAFPHVALPKGKLHRISIVLKPSDDNPFLAVNGNTTLRFDPGRRLLLRDDGYVRIPGPLGKLVMRRASLRATTGSGGGHTGLYAGLGVGGAAALAVLAVARRKRIH
jgi:hypothetical protein